jgi:hypothetical protein
MSIPIVLLATSIYSTVAAFGVYFGIGWKNDLDKDVGLHDSRNIFIASLVCLGIRIFRVYLALQLIRGDD